MTSNRSKRSAFAGFLLAAAAHVAALTASPGGSAAGTTGPGDDAAITSATGSYLAGRFARNQDDWRSAARYMARALASDPAEINLVHQTFLLKLGDGDMDAALALGGMIAGLGVPEGAPADASRLPMITAAFLAADHLAKGRLDAAAAMADRVSEEGVGRFVAPLTRAWVLAAKGRTDDALAALAPLSGATGFAALYDLNAGLLLELGGRTDAAAERYARVAAEEPPLRVVQIVGSFYERTGRTDRARALYEGFRASNPNAALIEPALAALNAGRANPRPVANAREGLAEAMFDLGSALHQEGADETALLFGRIALRLDPAMALSRLMLGDVMSARDRHEEALEEYRALENDPVLGWAARLRSAEALTQLKRTEEAAGRLEAMAAERPQSAEALIRLGDLYRAAERWADAVDAYGRAIERVGAPQERHWRLFYARAIALDELDRWPAAEADLEKALELRPDDPFLLNYLGYTWVDKGMNLEKARAMIERAVEQRPRDGYIVDSLGWALYRMGDYAGAVTHLERAVELKPVDPTINDHLGDAYWMVGRKAEARFQWQRALRAADVGDLDDEAKEQIRVKLERGLPPRQAAEADGVTVR